MITDMTNLPEYCIPFEGNCAECHAYDFCTDLRCITHLAVRRARVERKFRLFVDIDGTLAKWVEVPYFEKLLEKGFFRNMEPNRPVVQAVKYILGNLRVVETFTLSAYLPESPHALGEKNEWLDEHLPQIDMEHRLFCPCGEDKAMYVPGGIRRTDVLLDDYSPNLLSWDKQGRGLKLLNGVNGTNGTWKGAVVEMAQEEEKLAAAIIDFIIPFEGFAS